MSNKYKGISSGDLDREQFLKDDLVRIIEEDNRLHRYKFKGPNGEREALKAGYPHPNGSLPAQREAAQFKEDTAGLPRTKHRDINLPLEKELLKRHRK